MNNHLTWTVPNHLQGSHQYLKVSSSFTVEVILATPKNWLLLTTLLRYKREGFSTLPKDKINLRLQAFIQKFLPSLSQSIFTNCSSGPNVIFNGLAKLHKECMVPYLVNVIIITTSHDVELGIWRNTFDVEISIIDTFKMRESFNDRLLVIVVTSSRELC